MRKAINNTLKALTITAVISYKRHAENSYNIISYSKYAAYFGGILYTVFDKGKIRFKIKNKYIGTMLRRL